MKEVPPLLSHKDKNGRQGDLFFFSSLIFFDFSLFGIWF